MTPRRKETSVSRNQPVRFYKIVALSFLLITIVLLGMIVFMSSKRATITITTKATPVNVNFTVEIGETTSANQVAGAVVTSTVSLTKSFSPNGNSEAPGIAAGIITLHNISKTAQPLVVTTRFLSPDGILFRLKKGDTAPAQGTVDVEVYADQAGKSGNIGPANFTIPGLNEARQKEVYGTSAGSMSGGMKTIGVLSQEDIDKAEKEMLEQIRLEGEKKLSSEGHDNLIGIFSVVGQSYKVNAELGKEVTEFVMSMNATVLGIFYNKDDIAKFATDALMKKAVMDSDNIQPSGSEPTITLDSYDQGTGKTVLSVFYDGIASLNPGSKQLDKTIFFGKSRDDIRRYVLSLDHVNSVDIDFTPAWIRTVPQVKDHVNVVVKSVR
ncbi:MAG: hypothetical protein WC862_01395 [Patescibacteria group bacterium]